MITGSGSSSTSLAEVATRVRNGERPTATVREILLWFDAQKRGYRVLKKLREELLRVGLVTDPDIEAVHLDALLEFRPAEITGTAAAAVPELEVHAIGGTVVGTSTATATLTGRIDPTFRLGRLEAANRQPTSVGPEQHLSVAITQMLLSDYSQLPVMTTNVSVRQTPS